MLSKLAKILKTGLGDCCSGIFSFSTLIEKLVGVDQYKKRLKLSVKVWEIRFVWN